MSTPRSQRSDSLDNASSSTLLLSPGITTPSGRAPSNAAHQDGGTALPSNASNATYATFSPATLSSTTPSASSAAKRRSTILVHQKSPLLLATPPQITRALAYSHPFLLPLNRLVGLLSWTTGDPWESFLLVALFWAVVLYGDTIVRVAGPVVFVLILIAGMYGRRFSPLSSSGWSEPGLAAVDGASLAADGTKGGKAGKQTGSRKNLSVDNGTAHTAGTGKAGGGGAGGGPERGHKRAQSSISEVTNTRHQKTLDEIVETLKEFTGRCNILLEPLLELTDFLSTQRTPTSATTRPALTTLFMRIVLCTPFWFALTLRPLTIITTRRVTLVFGTIVLTWHARPTRAARTILWRSATVRRLLALVTGLEFEVPTKPGAAAGLGAAAASAIAVASTAGKAAATAAATASVSASGAAAPTRGGAQESELTKALRRARGGHDAGVRFTFIIYENQRRWVGLGWTTSLFAYERPAWTDEHNHAVPPRAQFELPEVEDGSRMRWHWVPGSRWRVDGVPDEAVMSGDGDDKGKDKEGEHGEDVWDYDGPGGKMGWVYYDNKWQNGRRGADGWGRWTRRRKWYRDAELVEIEESEAPLDGDTAASGTDGHVSGPEETPSPPPPALPPRPITPDPSSMAASIAPSTAASTAVSAGVTQSTPNLSSSATTTGSITVAEDKDSEREKEDEYDSASMLSSSSRSMRFRVPSLRRRATDASYRSRRASEAAASEDDASSLGREVNLAIQDAGTEGGSWGVGDEVRMGLE